MGRVYTLTQDAGLLLKFEDQFIGSYIDVSDLIPYIPTMISNTTPSPFIISSITADFPEYYACDNDASTYYNSATQATPHALYIKLDTSISAVSFYVDFSMQATTKQAFTAKLYNGNSDPSLGNMLWQKSYTSQYCSSTFRGYPIVENESLTSTPSSDFYYFYITGAFFGRLQIEKIQIYVY